MALDTFGNLKTSIQKWSKRDDSLSLLDDFILLAENEMYKNLRVLELETTAIATATSKDLTLPTGYIEMRRLRAISGNEYYNVIYTTPNGLENQNTSGIPKVYTITSQINFDRATTNDIEMQYYKKEIALSDSNTTNEILTNYPDIYLYGSLWALWKWALDEVKSDYYYSMLQNAIKSANNKAKSGRYTNFRMKKKGSNP